MSSHESGWPVHMLNTWNVPPLTIGQRIRSARRAKGWTLDQLAQRLGISKVSISCWENDKSRPRASRLTELSEVLDLPSEYLVEERFDSPRSAGPMAALMQRYQMQIAQELGVYPHDVEIKISFGGGVRGGGSGEVSEGPLSDEQFLSLGGELSREQQRLQNKIIDLSISSVGRKKNPALREQLERVTAELETLLATYRSGE